MRHNYYVFQRTSLQRTSTEVNVYIRHHQMRSFVGNVIYHKISHCDISYRVSGKNVNVMLEFVGKLTRNDVIPSQSTKK